MKNRLKTLFRCLLLAVVIGAVYTVPSYSQSKGKAAHERNIQLDELSFTEMINSVPLDEKQATLIRKFQEKEARDRILKSYGLDRNGCNVETFRNKEVLLITIPASKLFLPNSTKLRPDASNLLNPLKRYLKESDMYRMLIVMHTDNTGSEGYREKITEERSTAVFDWFDRQNLDTEYLFSYAYADEMPLVENNSMSNRDKNRRLEIFLVPGETMAEQAKKGRIVF